MSHAKVLEGSRVEGNVKARRTGEVELRLAVLHWLDHWRHAVTLATLLGGLPGFLQDFQQAIDPALEPGGRVNGVPKRKQRFRAGPFL